MNRRHPNSNDPPKSKIIPTTADEIHRELMIQELAWEAEDQLTDTRLPDSLDSHDLQVSQEKNAIREKVQALLRERSISTDSTLEVQEKAWEKGEWGKLSIGVFLRFALEADARAGRQKHYAPAFELARYCRGYPRFASLTGEEVLGIILPYLSDYSEQQQFNFVRFFTIAKSIPSETALARGLQMPLLRQSVSPLYDRFISMAGWAQKELGEANI